MKVSGNDADVVDTSGQAEVILVFDAARARRELVLDDGFARVVRDLVLGVPVAGAELDAWSISALGVATRAEIEAQADLFAHYVH